MCKINGVKLTEMRKKAGMSQKNTCKADWSCRKHNF